ncbi:MAG: hypothetical protein AB4911_18845 [Oscillochloridaceae bacterium umkhey_bin13]
MQPSIESATLNHLAALRPALVNRVAEELAASLPPINASVRDLGSEAHHHERMYSTAERFHEMLLAAVLADWGMVAFEYGWAARVLRPLGVTWEHQERLIQSYFATARELTAWDEDELAALAALEQQVLATCGPIYAAN